MRRVLACLLLLLAPAAALAAPATVVAVGASNTSGWGVGEAWAYPAQLERLLQARGVEVNVVNSGIPFETTNGMLARIDESVPNGTAVAIIQPGANDLRFLGTRERRTANIDAMVARLTARGIKTVVYDPVFASEDYQWDRIHLTREAHGKIAAELLPRIVALLGKTKVAASRRKSN